MSMEDLWPRQSVHGWFLFLGIKSVYNDYKQQKWKQLPRQVPRLACFKLRRCILLNMVLFLDHYSLFCFLIGMCSLTKGFKKGGMLL